MNTPTKPGYYWVQLNLGNRWSLPRVVWVRNGALGLMAEQFGKRTMVLPIQGSKAFKWLSEVLPPKDASGFGEILHNTPGSL